MEFTGERYVPNPDQPNLNSALIFAQIKLEHWHRYALSLPFVTGKQVLDIASGEGYGSALLARQAKTVVGVDIAPESIAHAEQAYQALSNLSFLAGSCESLPLPAAAVDVVTSFETIEHHDKHEEMMREVKRVLKPDGMLILSSPNKAIFTDKLNYTSPYHIKELYFSELCALLRKHFTHVKIFGQKVTVGSLVYPLGNEPAANLPVFSPAEPGVSAQVPSLPEPLYYIALCSEQPLPIALTAVSLYLDQQTDLLQLTAQEYHQRATREAEVPIKQLTQYTGTLEQLAEQLQTQLRAQEEQLQQITKSRAWQFMQLLWRLRRAVWPSR
ncbi:MAG: methyltransferase domain-containing protein [Acidobacteria bacterium]|nr:methyltransferase domain-containing protein [Acidobacteriota bacterium]MBI3423618.1 methyltransferase domain-containing protein [Acidobacteriota bacterium]